MTRNDPVSVPLMATLEQTDPGLTDRIDALERKLDLVLQALMEFGQPTAQWRPRFNELLGRARQE